MTSGRDGNDFRYAAVVAQGPNTVLRSLPTFSMEESKRVALVEAILRNPCTGRHSPSTLNAKVALQKGPKLRAVSSLGPFFTLCGFKQNVFQNMA